MYINKIWSLLYMGEFYTRDYHHVASFIYPNEALEYLENNSGYIVEKVNLTS